MYGFRACDSRMNLRYNTSGNPVFMSAALGVILDKKANTQKIFGGLPSDMVPKNMADETKCHMDDILSLDVSPCRKFVATG